MQLFRLLLCSLLFPVLIARAEQPSPTEPIKVGLIMPLTGNGAPWGKHMQNALTLAQESLAPEIRAKFSVIVEDDQLKAAKAVNAFNRLSDTAAVSVAIIFGGQSVAATAPLAEKSQLPSFMITANAELVKGKAYSFRHWLGAQEQVEVLVPAIQGGKIQRLAVVATTQEATVEFVTRAKAALSGAGVSIVFDESYPPEETDFRTATQKIAVAKADGVLFGMLPPQNSIFSRQLREKQLSVQIFGGSTLGTISEVDAARGALEGALYASPSLTQDFIMRYQERFNSFPELSAGNVYDIVMMIAEAVKRGAKSRQDFTAYIRGLSDFDGVLGRYGLLSDNSFELRGELWTVQDGRLLPAKPGAK